MDFFFERIAINDIEIQCCELSQNRIFYYEPAEATRVLFVTFSHLGFGKFSPAWGWDYCKDRKFSILGVVHKDENWFRSPDLMDFFNSSAYKKIIEDYEQVVFSGGSQGGYGALLFSETRPGSIVIAHNPQTTLRKDLVPWEGRFPYGSNLDWSRYPYDGACSADKARSVFVTYDPLFREDNLHVKRLPKHNLVALKVPMVGHAMPQWLLEMGILKELNDRIVDNTLDTKWFFQAAKRRRRLPRYWQNLFHRSKNLATRLLCVAKLVELGDNSVVFKKIYDEAVERVFPFVLESGAIETISRQAREFRQNIENMQAICEAQRVEIESLKNEVSNLSLANRELGERNEHASALRCEVSRPDPLYGHLSRVNSVLSHELVRVMDCFIHYNFRYLPDMFNEKLYLEQNPDVAQALQKNMLHSAFYHWLTNGITEQRRFSVVGDPGTEIDHS